VSTVTAISYGLFQCFTCRDGEDEECGDSCFVPFLDELPPLGDDYWPSCKHCGAKGHLVTPLLTV
jgi:hypothetical protein